MMNSLNWPNIMRVGVISNTMNAETQVRRLEIFANILHTLSLHFFGNFNLQIDKFMYAGQNLGQVKNSAKYQTVEAVISAVIQGWFDENKYADMNYMGKYQNHKSG